MTWPYEHLYMEMELLITLGIIYLFVMRAFLVWVISSVPNVIPQPHFIPKYIAPCMAVPMALLLGIYLFLPPHLVPPTPPMLWKLPGPLKEKLEII